MVSFQDLCLVLFCTFLGGCNQPSAPATNPQPISAIPNGITGSCAVTKRPTNPFVPAQSCLGSGDADFCYGTDRLWTVLPIDGIWRTAHIGVPNGLVLNYARTPPVYYKGMGWGRAAYDRYTEPHPMLKVTGKRLDAKVSPLVQRDAHGCCSVTDGEQPRFSVIAVAFDLPTLGCWEITGQYKGEALTFVIWATDKK